MQQLPLAMLSCEVPAPELCMLVSGEKALQETLETLLNRHVDSSTSSDFNASAAGTLILLYYLIL